MRKDTLSRVYFTVSLLNVKYLPKCCKYYFCHINKISHKNAEGSNDYHEVEIRPKTNGRTGVMLIQDLTLRVSIVFDISLGIACEHAELVFGIGLGQIVNSEGTLAVNDVLLDHGFAAARFSNHHVKVANVFA